MKIKWKKLAAMSLIFSLVACFSCGKLTSEAVVMPKSNGNNQEQIAFHKKEIQKYRSQMEREDRNSQRALSRQDMNDARTSQDRKMQYQKKVQRHTDKMQKLSGGDGL